MTRCRWIVLTDEDADVKKERRKRKCINEEGGRWMERQRGRGGDVCQLLLHEDDRRVCVPSFLAGLYLAGENNDCMGVLITTGWALPPGSSQQKRALAAPLCLFMCNLSFAAVTPWCSVTFCVFISADCLTSSDKRPIVATEVCSTNRDNLGRNF